MKQVETWLNTFDRIVFDTSPVLHINRSNIPVTVIANVCDQTLLVVMAGKTSQQQVKKGIALLQGNGQSKIATVLNTRDQPTSAGNSTGN
ncbi:hypothetical protein [Vibrio sonorensis]|uniref:hypothetical protein n=1 Tax=Vibrio sonorensis TaxID=1004316 RepID=UPI001FE204DC|nr:hypothetical protein [Vibrio sonorensis]